MPARTSPTLYPPSPPTVHQLSRLATNNLRVKLTLDILIVYIWLSLISEPLLRDLEKSEHKTVPLCSDE